MKFNEAIKKTHYEEIEEGVLSAIEDRGNPIHDITLAEDLADMGYEYKDYMRVLLDMRARGIISDLGGTHTLLR